MSAPVTSAVDQLAIVRAHVESLQAEIRANSESQRTLFRLCLAGIAAVVALRKDISLDDLQVFLPPAPILAMGVLAFWLAETTFVVRQGRWLAIAEKNINRLAGEPLVQYEQALWQRRTQRFSWPPWKFWTVGLMFSGAYILAEVVLMQSSRLNSLTAVPEALYCLSGVALVMAGSYYQRLFWEIDRKEVASVSTTTKAAGEDSEIAAFGA
jgi:hypothetical protein